jgi:hypothetical protein
MPKFSAGDISDPDTDNNSKAIQRTTSKSFREYQSY